MRGAINTTMIYSHYVPAADEAEKLSVAFQAQGVARSLELPTKSVAGF